MTRWEGLVAFGFFGPAMITFTFVRRDQLRMHRGAAIIVVIAFFAIAMTLIGVWVRSALQQQQVVRRWHEKTQARWLAEAGVRRAVARLQADQDYRGERWLVAAEQLGGPFPAEIEIDVELTDGDDARAARDRKIVALARFPAGDLARAQATKAVDYRLSPTRSIPEQSDETGR